MNHPTMRRSEKQITDTQDLEAILQSASICRLAMTTDNTPYIIPMNYGYQDHTLYFHCAPVGRKLEILRKNPLVCFEIDYDTAIVDTGRPCDWTSRYTSIIGYGQATIINDPQAKKNALAIITNHYSPGTTYDYPDENVHKVTIIQVHITSMTAKKSQPTSTTKR
jgi:hypothetical protein